jgi:hypothetical protein
MRPKRSKYQIARFTVFHGGPPFLKARIPNNVRFFAVHHQICLVRRDSCIHCVGAQFLFPIETAILGGDNRILDFDADTGAMDFSLVRYVARSVQAGRVEWVPEPRLSRPGHERSINAAGRPYAAPVNAESAVSVRSILLTQFRNYY